MFLTLAIGILFYVVSLPTEPVFEQRLFATELRDYHTMLLERALLLISPVFTAYFAFEHDQTFLKPLICYFGRLKTSILKLVFFSSLLTFEFVVIASFYLAIPVIFTEYAVFDPDTFTFLSHIYLDQLILLFLMLTLFRRQSKASVVFMIVLYQIIVNFYEGKNFEYFYLLPFHSEHMLKSTLTAYYKISYVILLGLINTIKSLHMDLR